MGHQATQSKVYQKIQTRKKSKLVCRQKEENSHQDGRRKRLQLVLLEALPSLRCSRQNRTRAQSFTSTEGFRNCLVELVELPMGPFSISTTGGDNNGNCKELSNESHSSSSTSTGTEKRLSPVSSSLSIHPSISSSMSSISSNSSSSLPPYSELVKELGTL